MNQAVPKAWRELNSRQRDILITLYRQGPLPTGPFVELTTQTSAWRNLQKLAEAGLVAREKGESDGREITNRLTDDGHALAESVLAPDA
ncbi:hypothetical protein OSG_eHP27_00095 [environmental Halophage eHP-27]|jgi:DNA-binding MarR family transcriptional regulator|nr:hypothetical protein OSG_eHP27_00095 [environmental Halophage eHP-27]